MAIKRIHFFCEDIAFQLKNKGKLRDWIKQTIQVEGMLLAELNFIFCSDDYLLKINQEYLKHDTFTDIITFDNREDEVHLSGDIYISIERIRENATTFKTPETDELHRVMIHGVLHLLGYKDKGKEHKKTMSRKEDEYLLARP